MAMGLVAASSAHAETREVSMSWHYALRLARTAPLARAAIADAEAARARAAEARAAAWPQLTLSGLVTPWQKAPDVVVPDSAIVIAGFPLPGFSFEARTARKYATAADLSLPLWTWGRLGAVRRAASAGADAAAAVAERTADDLAYDATEGFVQALLAAQLADVARADLALRTQLADAARQRERLGELAAVDRLAAQADSASSAASVVRAEAAVRTTREALALVLGLRDTLAVAPAGSLEGVAQDIAGLPVDGAAESADLRAARLAARAAAAQLTAARRERWPALGAVARLAYQSDALGRLVAPETRVSSLGVGFSMPVFDGGAIGARGRAAAAASAAAREREQTVRDRLAFELRQATADADAATAELGARRLAAQLAAERAGIATRAFRTGIVSARDADAAAVGAQAAGAAWAEAQAAQALAFARQRRVQAALR